MKVVGVVGSPDAGVERLADRIVDELADRGRVAVVERTGAADGGDPAGTPGARQRPRENRGATAVSIGDDGAWTAAGEERTLSGTLDALAARHDYAVLVGFPGADVAQVVVGGVDHAGSALRAADDAGSVDPATVAAALEDVEPHESLASLVAAAKRSPRSERAGAIATFTGRVRARDAADDDRTERLEFEKYEGVAADRLAAIREELLAREGIHEVLLHHRTGVVEAGEDIVFVVVLAGHREEAFRTVEDGIDRLKAEVPIFKKEVTAGDEFWVHDRD